MLYFILGFVLFAIAVIVVYAILNPLETPNMTLSGVLSENELTIEITDLATNMASVTTKSRMSIGLIATSLKKAYKVISKKVGYKKCLDFEKWIYDNYYKLTESIADQRKLIPEYNRLPGYKDAPRVYLLAQYIVKGSGGVITNKLIKKCVDAFNKILPLRFDEIEMLPSAINLALIEYVAIFCSRSVVINDKFNCAIKDINAGKIRLEYIKYNSYSYAFVKYADGGLLKKYDDVCALNGLSAYKKANNFLSACARYTGAVSSAVTTLHKLAPSLSDEFLLSLSSLNEYMENSKTSYKKCTTQTKFIYLQIISSKAKRKKLSEIAIAGEAINSAKKNEKDIAYYILPQPFGKAVFALYALVLIGYTISNCITVYMISPQYKVLAASVFIPISFALVLAFISSINVKFFARRFMPRAEVNDGTKAMIVFPVLVFNEKEVDEMIDNLLTVSFANTDKIFSYGLLLDLPATKEVELSNDEIKIVRRAKERFSALDDRFNLFIRKRTKVRGENTFQGWEKKRGAILELNNLIMTDINSSFDIIYGNSYHVDYVITLDGDTMINCAYELVQIMEHPYNANKAVAGINVNSHPLMLKTNFANIMSGSVGLSGYVNYIPDVNYDLFGSGNYTGKGIYRVKEFSKKVGDVFMDNRVLSHDFVEGAVAGCGNSGEGGLDYYPKTFSSYLKRNLRWLRGDYQLLPFLLKHIKNSRGKKINNPISAVAKLHIICNLILGIVPIASMILLIVGLFSSEPVVLFAIAFSLNLFSVLSSLRTVFSDIKSTGRELLRQLLLMSCLPVVAYNYCKAILITVYRLIVKKNLLEWNVFSHSDGNVSFAPNFLFALIFIFAAGFVNPQNFIVAVLFVVGIPYAYYLGKSNRNERNKVSVEAESLLKKVAADTWIYFEKQLTSKNNYLPYDNYQEENEVGYAPRTSPTDIAFMIVALVSARELDFITEKEFLRYSDNVLASIEKADKWRGNVYNWLNIYSLKRLNGYVSSVDSGNLLAALILLRNSLGGDNKKRAEKLIADTDMRAFFDNERGLLRIGYDDDKKQFDSNYYDLLGSEAMLTYLVGIGIGKLKSSCFKNLSRRSVKYKGSSLYSWTGGVFEYMMSGLFFRYPDNGMLLTSAESVLKANVSYAKKHKNPFWGTSESQYSLFDECGNYQYKAFGVPDISLSNERRRAVVSPYASLLFLQYFPNKVSDNIIKMRDCGMFGNGGVYEAYDNGVIKTYMAHHQGMIMASICNYFCQGRISEVFASSDMKAAALHIALNDKLSGKRKREYNFLPTNEISRSAENGSLPDINLMTNGRYSVLIDACGNGYSYFNGKYVSRHYNFDGGLKLYLNRLGQRIDVQRQTCRYFGGKSEFIYRDDEVEISQQICVMPNIDGELRHISVTNRTSRRIEVTLESYMEVALDELYRDISHKTFSGMFVTTEYNAEFDAAFARRGNLGLFHYFDVLGSYQSNRGEFFGRSHGDDFGRVLDPIVSGKVVLTLEIGETRAINLYNIVGYDYETLKKQVRFTKREGFYEKAISAVGTFARGSGVNLRMNRAASKLIYGANANLLSGDLPLICFETNTISLSIKNKIKMLEKLALWGIKTHVVFVSVGGAYVKEKLNEALRNIETNSCVLSFFDKEIDCEQAKKAIASATDLDIVDLQKYPYCSVQKAKPLTNAILPRIDYAFTLGKGGFLHNGAYALEMLAENLPPRPWCNIISNDRFGTVITESGGGYSYFNNSRENKLTEWSNDPVGDNCSEGVVIFENGLAWSCSVQPNRVKANYQVIHDFGVTEFRSDFNGFYSRQREYIVKNTKYYELTLTSFERSDRYADVMFFVLPVLGDFKFKTERNLVAKLIGGRLLVENIYNGSRFYIGSDRNISDYVCHKQSYVDKNGLYFNPQKDFGYEFAPAIKTRLYVPPLCSVKVIFYLSADGDVDFTNSEQKISDVKKYYSSLSCLSLSCGNKAINYISKWLPYQVMNSRFWGRTGFYQAGGAIGFRDQLQDCLSVLYVDPELVRRHILNCASHQFEEGDVMHWWHEPRTGVRTKISDDRLFLPYIVVEYIQFTGDEAILRERTCYLENMKIIGKDCYGTPNQTVKTGTILEHCLKAIKASAKLGNNDLVLIGGGDWNDGMDNVGIEGKGTTVWGSMFLYFVIKKFMPYIKNKKPYLQLLNKLKAAIEKTWDGEWYTRAYFDNGDVLGSKTSKECNIDLITQSFAIISGSCDINRAKTALYSAASRLVDTKNGIIKLLTPPLSDIKAGYISDYPPGVRENGGQYTHGAVWFIMSLFEVGEYEYAYSLLDMINPINHSKTAEDVNIYEVEPYVISGDVYSFPPGKGGWSWYTGAASWYYYLIVRYLFGIIFRGDVVIVEPKMPKSLKTASFTLKKNGITVTFKIENNGDGEWTFCLGERSYNSNEIRLTDNIDGKEITVKRIRRT